MISKVLYLRNQHAISLLSYQYLVLTFIFQLSNIKKQKLNNIKSDEHKR
ncbi:MAG: hypothetical protein ucyna2_00899 [Candidatus Atelocyanobacterium thalassa isolate SIO64986]|uniref:Uncharacterized protein n=1 Tax=Candidatus Atelocyanobacterium thalassa isolate SIO64986 TaxID=1527444 RepID=A0A086CGG0_9CHRO|nr:MAG: hypothetical protein ucyna2_00899 [Candidatus Atelocyanobacterium thalassa isolate SIO64986]